MQITISEKQLLDLLEECLPVLRFAEGGCNCDNILAKVEYVLRLAGRQAADE